MASARIDLRDGDIWQQTAEGAAQLLFRNVHIQAAGEIAPEANEEETAPTKNKGGAPKGQFWPMIFDNVLSSRLAVICGGGNVKFSDFADGPEEFIEWMAAEAERRGGDEGKGLKALGYKGKHENLKSSAKDYLEQFPLFRGAMGRKD